MKLSAEAGESGGVMKKALKIAGIVLLSICVCVAAVVRLMAKGSATPKDYNSKIETGGDIEAKYLQNGPYDVSFYEEPALQNFEKYEIFYPSELESLNKRYPAIIVCNGTGWVASKSRAIYEHYASWGFIVVANEETHSWNAFGAEMAVRHLRKLNASETINDKPNAFCRKIDFDHVGIIGHSQGGVGVINAITNTDSKDVYKTAVSLSPTNKELAESLEWSYDATKIDVPIMLISGEGGGDDWVVTGEGLESIYNDIGSPKVMARRLNTPHGETQYKEDGYVTAWFMWHLQGDAEASEAFIGDEPELLDNPLYQDQKINLE